MYFIPVRNDSQVQSVPQVNGETSN